MFLAFFFSLVVSDDLLSDIARNLVITLKAQLLAPAALCHLTNCDSIVEQFSLRSLSEDLLLA